MSEQRSKGSRDTSEKKKLEYKFWTENLNMPIVLPLHREVSKKNKIKI